MDHDLRLCKDAHQRHHQRPQRHPVAVTIPRIPGHFIKVFKDSYSLPPIDYVREVRLNEACRMLLTTNLPLSRIAAEVGWGSVSNFIHYFVSKNNITPARYRRINRNPQL